MRNAETCTYRFSVGFRSPEQDCGLGIRPLLWTVGGEALERGEEREQERAVVAAGGTKSQVRNGYQGIPFLKEVEIKTFAEIQSIALLTLPICPFYPVFHPTLRMLPTVFRLICEMCHCAGRYEHKYCRCPL